MELARRLERVERLKAEERRNANLKQNENTECQNSDGRGRSDDTVAEKTGFGSRDTYRKAKYIDDNADTETIEKLDAGEISIHRAWKERKETKDKLGHITDI